MYSYDPYSYVPPVQAPPGFVSSQGQGQGQGQGQAPYNTQPTLGYQQPQQPYAGGAGAGGGYNNAPYQPPTPGPNYGSPPLMNSAGGYPQHQQQPSGGYQHPPPQTGYGGQGQPAYGSAQTGPYGQQQPQGQTGYGQPQPAYGQAQPAHGAAQPAYGGAPQPTYTAPPQGAYGAPQQPPYGTHPATPYQPTPFNLSAPYFLGVPIPAPPPAPPLPSLPTYQPSADVDKLRKATKGFGTDEKALIDVLARVDGMQVDLLSRTFEQMVGKSLKRVLEKELSGWVENGLVLCSLGPLGADVQLLHRAMAGVGTHEDLLNELLLGRTNLEIHLLKEGYQRAFGKDLVRAVQGELSMKTERMFNMALSGARDENPQVNHQLVQTDIAALHKAGAGQMGTDEITICGILLQRSNEHLRDLAMAYQSRYKRTLSQAIASEFSGHMRDALMYIARGAEADGQGIQRDADMLEAAMAGAGTKDERLTWRIVRGHWNRPRFEAVKQAYQKTYGKSLKKRVEGETTGKFERLLVALIQ